MAGGPSHLETLDFKPKLREMDGKPIPESFTKGKPIAQLQGKALKCLGPQHDFAKFGKSGQSINALFKHVGSIADDICIINSLQTEAINHDPAHTFMNTGSTVPGRPSMGSWINYGLGTETDNLPGYVVLTSLGKFGQAQPIAARQWHSGFLPSRFQGVEFRSTGDPVLYVNAPPGVDIEQQRRLIQSVRALNQAGLERFHDPEILARIAQYELAFRMQTSVPELMDVSSEPRHILDMYGTERRVLRALLAMTMPFGRATMIAARVGQALAFVLGFLGLFGNPFLIFIALFVYLGATQENAMAHMKDVTSGLHVTDAMVTELVTLNESHTIDDAVDALLRTSQQEFPVLDDDHQREHDADHHARQHAERQHAEERERREEELAAADAPQPSEVGRIDHAGHGVAEACVVVAACSLVQGQHGHGEAGVGHAGCWRCRHRRRPVVASGSHAIRRRKRQWTWS